uniref:Uncharacterized protein n=1 Tax=Mycena chlorophos TaxID=658473 RepID=A0ABQ0LMG8_MYCCL|nr:predicted protein [Mycena chlorophos]
MYKRAAPFSLELESRDRSWKVYRANDRRERRLAFCAAALLHDELSDKQWRWLRAMRHNRQRQIALRPGASLERKLQYCADCCHACGGFADVSAKACKNPDHPPPTPTYPDDTDRVGTTLSLAAAPAGDADVVSSSGGWPGIPPAASGLGWGSPSQRSPSPNPGPSGFRLAGSLLG